MLKQILQGDEMGLASFFFGKQARQEARTEMVAAMEFAAFIQALDMWKNNSGSFEDHQLAIHHFMVFDTRLTGYTAHGRGNRSIPAIDVELGRHWLKHLMDARLLNSDGTPSHWHEQATMFWNSVAELRSDRDRLLQQADDMFGSQGSGALKPGTATRSSRRSLTPSRDTCSPPKGQCGRG